MEFTYATLLDSIKKKTQLIFQNYSHDNTAENQFYSNVISKPTTDFHMKYHTGILWAWIMSWI